MTLRVLDGGLYTLVVDHGRPRTRSLGVPVSGAADRLSLAIGNALVGNPPDAAALEFSLAGPTLTATCDLACVVFGAPFSLQTNLRYLTVGTTFTLQAGEELYVGGTPKRMRAYLCVRGGLQTEVVLGSRSSLRALKSGDLLPCSTSTIRPRFPRFSEERDLYTLRYLPGPQADWFAETSLEKLAFQVTPASNRMGLRVVGPPLRVSGRELVSEPVCPGAVQVTRDGQCILLGIDGQTIGGYPKIAQVIAADLDHLGQLRPGDPVHFVQVSLEEAERLYHARRAWLRSWVLRLRAASHD